MALDTGFDRGQENPLPMTPLSSRVMDRLRRFRGNILSPQQVTTPSPIRSFSEAPARTSSNEPPPLNNDIGSISLLQQQIVPRMVTPMLLQDQPPNELVQNEFLLQIQAAQQISQEIDDSR